jgi:hypothetical protein
MTATPRRLVGALALAAAFSLACAGLMPEPEPVPADKADYVGSWTGEDRALDISADGTASWENTAGAGETSVNGNIAFTDEGFSIGLPPMAIPFIVNSAPAVDGKDWTMTINGDVVMKRPAAADEVADDAPAEDAGGAPPSRGGKADGVRGGRRGR